MNLGTIFGTGITRMAHTLDLAYGDVQDEVWLWACSQPVFEADKSRTLLDQVSNAHGQELVALRWFASMPPLPFERTNPARPLTGPSVCKDPGVLPRDRAKPPQALPPPDLQAWYMREDLADFLFHSLFGEQLRLVRWLRSYHRPIRAPRTFFGVRGVVTPDKSLIDTMTVDALRLTLSIHRKACEEAEAADSSVCWFYLMKSLTAELTIFWRRALPNVVTLSIVWVLLNSECETPPDWLEDITGRYLEGKRVFPQTPRRSEAPRPRRGEDVSER